MDINTRNDLIKYRLEQEIETIELVEFLIASKEFDLAINRIYYGMYYSLTALALKHEFNTSKHIQLIGWFNKQFIASALIDKRFGRIIRLAYQNRTKGDYDAYVTFEKRK
ncbi:MAG: HEPN domain-containing protein [Deltaproteobacteria bacterium]